MYAVRTFTCGTCPAEVTRRAPAGAVVYCVPCGIERSAEAARQLHAKSGEFYQRWQWAYLTSVRRMARALPAAEAARSEQQRSA